MGKGPKRTSPPGLSPTQAAAQFERAVALHQAGRLAEAQSAYDALIRMQPRHFEALHLRGVLAAQTNNHALAAELIGRAIEINPHNPVYYRNRGISLQKLKQLDAAVACQDQAISLKPDFAEAYSNRGNALRELKQLEAAVASYDRAVALKPGYAEAFYNRACVLEELGQPAAAVASYDRAIALKPDFAEAHNNRGNALKDLGQWEAAVASYDRAVAIRPGYAAAYYNRGVVLHDLGNPEAAVASYDQAIGARPDYAEAFSNRGNALAALGRLEAAVASYDRAVAARPERADAYYNRGNALQKLSHWRAAVASYDQAIALKPDYAEAYSNRGNALIGLRQLDAAIASHDHALLLRPEYAEAYNNRGNALRENQQLDAAVASYDRAVAIDPAFAEAYFNRGNVLREQKQLVAAVASYDRAIALKPDQEFVAGLRLHTKMMMCDWDGFTDDCQRVRTGIEDHRHACTSFVTLSVFDSPALQRTAAEVWNRAKLPAAGGLGPIPMSAPRDKIRVGYYSADFHEHAIPHLIAGMFEAHDRSKFEIMAFSYGRDATDAMRARLVAAFDRFIDVRRHGDRDIARLSRERGIDIAVDLIGATASARTAMFVERCAPIQVNYLGYPGTLGTDCMDYILADPVVLPVEHEAQYAEQVVRLPHSYQVNDDRRAIADVRFTRAELGLPATGFVFCCFNNNYKILPAVFDAWMRIVKAVDGSVLWLLADNPAAADNLRRHAAQRGVDGDRLVFAGRMRADEHLARHRLADLFLDTLPYNAHTTASDALWAGLPVLTQIGGAFAARVAASLVTAAGVPELIVGTPQEYEARAVELARDPTQLSAIRTKLAAGRGTVPLFDTKGTTRYVEAAYQSMYERYRAGLPPAGFAVAP